MNTPSVQSLVSKYLSPIKGTRGELKEVNSRAGTGKVYMRLEHLVMSENMELLKKRSRRMSKGHRSQRSSQHIIKAVKFDR